ncbi:MULTISPECIES: ACP S-malonyltransferase [unclassified Treponema]|uniref:ACP S-malonyltransferase n=1 Tax=unclassified Treponema TaxID=2638727 RepID=UPI0020A44B2F|nr:MULTISPECIES: ACP S-malonyltransferase [unclassified Treponema]UTC66537.1 ACP S-malonyltransferase [Treponema sp. OMZ 789]UTC69269.1 ACP S-malonyltransferase [Treponema sp. OMZ 790]UTC71983.1 ACP S-malonyltransferase [Treponema sp. OMZ 791]
MKNIFLFSGQGAQFKGMAQDIVEKYGAARDIIKNIGDITGEDIDALLRNTENEVLSRSDKSQLAIIAVETAILAVLKEKGITPSAVAGFSLGEFSALYASGILSFEDMIRIVQKRGAIMQAACDKIAARASEGSGALGMSAILKLDPEKVIELLKPHSDPKTGIVFAANMNSPVQTVISGTAEGLTLAEELCKEAGAKRCVRLAVAGPFHSPLMEEAAKEFEEVLKGFNFKNPEISVFSNVTGKKVKSGEEAKANAVLHLTHPVLWTSEEKEIASLCEDLKPCRLLEIGPGNTLCNLWRDSGFASDELTCSPTGTLEQLNKIIE